LYIRENGKTTYVSAKTRSWEQAERFAQAERDKRDPVKVQLQKIAEQEMAKAEASAAKLVPLKDAFEQWLDGMKKPGNTSVNAYRSTCCFIRTSPDSYQINQSGRGCRTCAEIP
jgi:predicted P-loop ATPase